MHWKNRAMSERQGADSTEHTQPLHCHMNYHLASGMMLLIRYTHSKQDNSAPDRPFWEGQDSVCDKISAV